MAFKFDDVLKKSFIQTFGQSDISATTIIIALAITAVLAFYIFFLYKALTKKTFYSKNFGISLVCVSLITTAIITAVQSNIIISLGMVGALSIVRFRTAIKDPMDLAFLFWSISIGIICGANLYVCAIILSVLVSIVLIILEYIPIAKAPMILVVNCSDNTLEQKVLDTIKKYAKYSTIKSRNMTATTLDLTIELRTNEGSKLIKEVAAIDKVLSANLLAHDGEVTF